MTNGTHKEKKPFDILIYLAVTLSVFLLLALPVFLRKKKEEVTYRRPLLGTVVEITLMDGDRASFDSASDAAFAEIKRLEGIFSSYRMDSDVSLISRNAGKGSAAISTETVTVIEKAVEAARMSDGAFDPTIGSLAVLWGFSGEKGVVPSKRDVSRLLPLVNYRAIYLDRNKKTAGLKKKGMVLNLGGVAKGYIVSKAAETLKSRGVKKGIVKAGGDLFVFTEGGEVGRGVEKEGKPFTIGIQHPRKIGALIGEAYVTQGAVATSGDYERFFMKDGVRYHHILNPRTGFPAEGTQSVTVVARDAAMADALSTAVFVMGRIEGMALIERLPDVEGVIVDSEGMIHTSSGFRGRIFKE